MPRHEKPIRRRQKGIRLIPMTKTFETAASRAPSAQVAVAGMAGAEAGSLATFREWLDSCLGSPAIRAEASATGDLDASVPVVLAYESCPAAVGRALAAGTAPDAALAQWLSAASDLLEGGRRRRRRAVMVDLALAARVPETLRAALADRLGLTLLLPGQGIVPPLRPAALYEVFAAQLLATSEAARQAQSELEARTLALDSAGRPAAPDVGRAIRDFADAAARSAGRLAALEEERTLLRMQLHQFREELEIQFSKARSFYREREQFRRKLTEERAALKAEHERQRRLHQQERDQLQGRIEELLRSTSWKVTAPLRRVRLMFTPGNR